MPKYLLLVHMKEGGYQHFTFDKESAMIALMKGYYTEGMIDYAWTTVLMREYDMRGDVI